MSTQWMLKTKGDPLGTVHHFVWEIWQTASLEALIIPQKSKGKKPILTDPTGLYEVNPFQPLMLMNIARVIQGVLKEHKVGLVGVLLRPCEMRALNAIIKRGKIQSERLLTICVDCLGTFPEDEFEWRAARKGTGKELTGEAIQFAPQGGISVYRYRAACQMCVSPGATEADVNIGILGLSVRQTVLVDVKNSPLDWKNLTDGVADPALSTKRDMTLAKLIERNARTRERVIDGLMEVIPTDIEAMIDHFEGCGSCQMCMDSCPICTVEYPRQVKGLYRREDLINWLTSCAGCGMCEQSCPQHLPLSIIFTHVKQQLQQAMAL